MRLIDADALMQELEREVEFADDWKTAHEIANCVKYAPTIDGWISVKDKTPEDGKAVLVWDDGGFAYVDTWIGYTWKIGGDFGVTHWQYLPEPPKEVTGDA